MSVKILIADDQAIVRGGFRVLLEAEPDFEVVGEAEDCVQAVALARRRGADVVLMDVRMPRMDGLQATRELAGPDVAPEDRIDVLVVTTFDLDEYVFGVLVVTTFDLDEYVFGALRAGAAGFLLKDAQPDVLVDAIRAVADGKGLVDPEVTRRLIARFAEVAPDPERGSALAELTDRERVVLLQVAGGRSNAQIAEALMVEESTVKTHVSAVLAKLGLRSRVQAVILAYESGLVTPGRAPSL
jgi:DNA-binding NarL/FixJ family response regulator